MARPPFVDRQSIPQKEAKIIRTERDDKLKSEWFVLHNPIDGGMYRAARILVATLIDTGKLEHKGKWTKDKAKAKALVDRLNKKGR